MGYQKVSFQPGLTIIGQQFTAIGGNAANIQTIRGEGMDPDGADTLRIWNGSRYIDYYYYPGNTADINGDGTDAWGDDGWTPVEVEIPQGTGMWISASNQAQLTFAGEVAKNTTVSFHPGLNLMAAPQPVDIDIQDIIGTGMDPDGADTLRVWNGTSYTDYYYYPGATCDINGDGSDAWGDDGWTPVDATIPAGQGFWLSASGSGTLIFPDATSAE